MTEFIRPGKIVEFGCGSGFVLEILSTEFPDSIIVGIDKSIERLVKVDRRLKEVIPMRGDFTQTIFPYKIFDTAIFVGSLHEVFSTMGRETVRDALTKAYDVLKDCGVAIIQDFLKPDKKSVEITFQNEETREKFFRFTQEYRQRRIEFEKKGQSVLVDIADAVEFVSKYRAPDEEDWRHEMDETHFFFTEQEYREMAEKAGFVIKDVKKLSKSKSFWSEIKKDIQFEYPDDYLWIQLVLIKG